jgi:flagellin
MPLTIGSNISALQTQRGLNQASTALSRALNRLASGSRITTASDDAAGLSVADQLRNKGRLYDTALRNINDGISVLSIISDTLGNQKSLVQRMIELAEQSANGTFSSAQRDTLSAEYRQLMQEFGRLGDSTFFNGRSLMLGGRGSSNPASLLLQLGIDGGAASRLGISLADTGTLSGVIAEYSALGSASSVVTGAEYESFDALMDAVQNKAVNLTVKDSQGVDRDIVLAFRYQYSNGTYEAVVFQRRVDIGDPGYEHILEQALSSDPDSWYAMSGVAVSVNSATGIASGTGTISVNLNFANGTATGALSVDLRGLRFLSPISAPPPVGTTDRTSNDGITSIEFTGVENVSRSRAALDILRNRLDQLSLFQGNIGANQSRLTAALEVARASGENTKGAESRIRDTDVASDSAILVASQIRQSVATSVLAQANQQTQLALSLLRF